MCLNTDICMYTDIGIPGKKGGGGCALPMHVNLPHIFGCAHLSCTTFFFLPKPGPTLIALLTPSKTSALTIAEKSKHISQLRAHRVLCVTKDVVLMQ